MDKTTGGRKLADKWEANPYVILSKHADLPVYTIKRVNSDRVRTVHRNLLTPCMFLPLDDLPQTSTGAVPPPTPMSPDTQTDQPEENGDEDEMSDRPDEGGDDGFFLRQNEDVRVPKRNGSHHEAAPRDPMPQKSADPHIEDTEANAPSPAPSEEMPQRHPTPQEPPQHPPVNPETPPPTTTPDAQSEGAQAEDTPDADPDSADAQAEGIPAEDASVDDTPVRRSSRHRQHVDRLNYTSLGHINNMSIYKR